MNHLFAALRVYIPLRIVASVWAAVVVTLFPLAYAPGTPVAADFAAAVPHGDDMLIAPWYRWDAQWVIDVARNGYERPGSTAFLPLYPALIAVLGGALAGEYLLAALIISNVAAVAALALLHLLVSQAHSERIANRTLVYFVLFPTSFYLLSAYTESLFLALVLGAFVLAERERWLLTALCAALAVFTRWQGVALIPALVWMYAQTHR